MYRLCCRRINSSFQTSLSKMVAFSRLVRRLPIASARREALSACEALTDAFPTPLAQQAWILTLKRSIFTTGESLLPSAVDRPLAELLQISPRSRLTLYFTTRRQTVNIEWYDPDSITTKDGALEITLTKETNASSHGRGCA